MRMRTLCRASAIVVCVLPLALSACGISPALPGASTTSQATLTCQEHSEVAQQPQDSGPQKMVTHDMACSVTGAPNSEQSFILQYQLKYNGKILTYGPTCGGPLQIGNGSCFQRYTEVVAVFEQAKPQVAGELLPSKLPLGPVTPNMPAAATLTCMEKVRANSMERLHKLTCTVTGAPSSDTFFTLHYTLSDSSGTTQTYPSTCDGSLQYGAGTGTCTQTYDEFIGVFKNPQVTVFGELRPSQEPLGPVTPTDPS
jgi:hypothetical protein